jgi:predicted DNA-binding transcriptional regulator
MLSLFMLIGFFKADIETGVFVKFFSFLITVILPLTGGAALIYSYYEEYERLRKSKENLTIKTLEAEVLKLAEKKGGKLTVVEVMSDFAMSNDTAKELLDSITVQGLADVELTESGVIVYSFYDIKHLMDKKNTKGVLDV